MGGGGRQSQRSWGQSESKIVIPDELKGLYGQTAGILQMIQSGRGGDTVLSPYLTENPMQVAPTDPLQSWVAQNVTKPWETPESRGQALDYMDLATQLSGKRATGEGIDTSPAVLKASEAFDKLMQPQIENQMGLAGLGRSSSLANAMAMGKTSYMLPMIQDELAREQESYRNQASMYAGMIPQLEGMGQTDLARQLQTLNAASTVGATGRGIAQEPLTAAYQDFMRRQALYEQSIYAPFGAMASASIGPHATSTQGSSGSARQGMFK